PWWPRGGGEYRGVASPQSDRNASGATNGGTMKRHAILLASLAAAVALVSLTAFVAVTRAEPASGVTPTVLARGTFPAFNVRSDSRGPVQDFRAHSTDPIDV